MKVIIDGIEYVAAGTRRITVDGNVYAALADPKPRAITDNDGDRWELRPFTFDTWTCVSYGDDRGDDISRDEIARLYGIQNQEF